MLLTDMDILFLNQLKKKGGDVKFHYSDFCYDNSTGIFEDCKHKDLKQHNIEFGEIH